MIDSAVVASGPGNGGCFGSQVVKEHMRMNARVSGLLKTPAGLCALLCGCMLAIFAASCETVSPDTTTSTVTVSPPSASITAGTVSAIQFVASGGSNYTWSVSMTSLGTISTSTNSADALYQSTTNAGVNVVTVTDTGGFSATATITQQ